MTDRTWLAARASLALALMVGFYALALGLAGGLLWTIYAQVVYADRVYPKLVLGCLVIAGTILWSIIPRPDRFEAPGPELSEREQPRLFKMIGEVAAATEQAMPADVYLVGDVNAFVSQRGGVMGFGSHRVMGLGLPLMQTLTVDELRGVLAHEFGHYQGGDVALGPWIYKTRAAMGRTIESLGESILQQPFVWYGNGFLRLTHAISRRQEFMADALAARVVGSHAMQSALEKVRDAAALFPHYWVSEVRTVLAAGLVPPIGAGFEAYGQSRTAALVRKATAEEDSAEADPYDTHPALAERLAALESIRIQRPAGDSPSAVTLLHDVPRLERRLLLHGVSDSAPRLRPIEWNEVGAAVYADEWRSRTTQHAAALGTITADEIPSDLLALAALGARVIGGQANDVLVQHAKSALASGLAALLVERGWRPETSPGEPIVFVRNGEPFDLFLKMEQLFTGKLARDDWRAECRRLEIAGVPLAAAGSARV